MNSLVFVSKGVVIYLVLCTFEVNKGYICKCRALMDMCVMSSCVVHTRFRWFLHIIAYVNLSLAFSSMLKNTHLTSYLLSSEVPMYLLRHYPHIACTSLFPFVYSQMVINVCSCYRCGHCKKLAPEWKKAANNLKGKVKLGHVNCDAEKVRCISDL